MMLKAHKYKIVANKAKRYAIARTLDVCRDLYNDSLFQRNLNHRSGNTCRRFDQDKELPGLKATFPVLKNVYSQVLQNVLDRLDKTFNGFFRRGFGFPRYKSARRYNSFTYPQSGFSLNGNILSLSKIGNVKLRLSRELPKDAEIKTCTILNTVNGLFAILTFEHEPTPLPVSDFEAGIDLGITKFAALSDGTFVENPRIYENAQPELRIAQRRLARRKNKKSHSRAKAVILLRKLHEKIRSKRLDFLHKETTKIVKKFGFIAMENLRVQNMAGYLPKQILDAGWSMWRWFTSYKAESAGRTIGIVPPQYTSQECDKCERSHPDNRKGEKFKCIFCNHEDHSDTNASKRILARAKTKWARMEPLGVNVSRTVLCVA
jgi:putative transposase